MRITLFALAAVLCVSIAEVRAQGAAKPGDPVLEMCTVSLVGDNDIEISANEKGVLTYLGVREGSPIEENAEIGKIDDRQAVLAREVAKYGLRAANERAKSDVERRHAEAAALVAEADYDDLKTANSGAVRHVVPETEIRRAKLEWDRAKLSIEKSKHDMLLAGMDAWTKKAELDAAELGIELRTIRAPFRGQVAEVFRHQNEWVNAGDPILRVIRLDTLFVEGNVYSDEYSPRDLQGCEVTVEVPGGGGEIAKVPGRVVYVNPELRFSTTRQQYVVRVEITNRFENGQWLVYPGQQATMTIHLGTATPTVGSRPSP